MPTGTLAVRVIPRKKQKRARFFQWTDQPTEERYCAKAFLRPDLLISTKTHQGPSLQHRRDDGVVSQREVEKSKRFLVALVAVDAPKKVDRRWKALLRMSKLSKFAKFARDENYLLKYM